MTIKLLLEDTMGCKGSEALIGNSRKLSSLNMAPT